MRSVFDLIIIGSGPAGLAAAIRAKELGMEYLVIEKGKEILWGISEFYPRSKKIYPTIPQGGGGEFPIQFLKPPEEKVDIKEYLARVRTGIEERGGLAIKTGGEFVSYKKNGESIDVETSAGKYLTKNLILAIGSSIPRELEVYGDAKPVARTLRNPEKYLGHPVLVIGGGNSGADVVISLSRLKRESGDDTKIYWAHKGEKFKVKRKVARDLGEEILIGGTIRILKEAKPVLGKVDETGVRRLTIRTSEHYIGDEIKFHQGMSFPMKNVIACIGFRSPAPIFKDLGLELMSQVGGGKEKELIVLDENLQTSVEGVYAIGGAISPSYIKRSKGDRDYGEVRHPNLIFTAVRDGVAVAEHIKRKLN